MHTFKHKISIAIHIKWQLNLTFLTHIRGCVSPTKWTRTPHFAITPSYNWVETSATLANDDSVNLQHWALWPSHFASPMQTTPPLLSMSSYVGLLMSHLDSWDISFFQLVVNFCMQRLDIGSLLKIDRVCNAWASVFCRRAPSTASTNKCPFFSTQRAMALFSSLQVGDNNFSLALFP